MKILFNCLRSGLSNNGGTKTLLQCQKTIRELGHKCDIATNRDAFTWFEHPKPIPKLTDNYDVIIATACTTINSTLYNSFIKYKFWYIRGHETWVPNYNEEILIRLYSNKSIIKIVNSNWLKVLLKSNNIKCYYAPQGINIEYWKDLDTRQCINKICIGCLYSNKPSKGWEQFVVLMNLLGKEKYYYISYGLKDVTNPNNVDEYYSNPSQDTLNHIYSKCNFWFAPTQQEGLHNPPMEAALCGARLIRSNSPRCGMQDYSNEQNSIVYNEVSNIPKLVELEDLKDNKQVQLKESILTNIKDRKSAMKHFIKILRSCI